MLFQFWVLVCASLALAKKDVLDWKNDANIVTDSQRHSWDFEFEDNREQHDTADDDDEKAFLKAAEIISENDLCKNLQCKPHQVCVVEDDDVALCISKRKLGAKENVLTKKKKENPCIPCPVLKPEFVCGSDNHTYSSVCRLEFRNCMHKSTIAIRCKGFCPCKATKTEVDHSKEWQMKERWNHYMNKYQKTVNRPTSFDKTPQSQGNEQNSVREGSDSTKKAYKGVKLVKPVIEKSCSETELKAMGDRLLDWFSVVMADHRRGQSRRRSFRLSHTQLPDCKPEVGWMFQHLDTDGDLKLSLQELYDLENDDQEHCLRPYLLDCDLERDLVLSPYEWCACFDKSQRPCASALRRIPHGLVGGYTPLCDSEGYYLPTQCHGGSGTCWCVDRHGVEFTNTRRRGRPDCESLLQRGRYQHEDQEEDSGEREGSADKPLDF